MAKRGHPGVLVRLHPEALRRLQELVPHERQPGQRGGVAGVIRKLVYEHLGFPGSDEWDWAVQEGGDPAPPGR